MFDLSLQQNISLGSACGTPPYTNFTAEFADCLDYIYYDKSNLEVEQVIIEHTIICSCWVKIKQPHKVPIGIIGISISFHKFLLF